MCRGVDLKLLHIGRTARIGNQGSATTFYNHNNQSIAPDLVKILIESGQEVPDFLESFKPSGELLFDSDDEDRDEEDTPDDDVDREQKEAMLDWDRAEHTPEDGVAREPRGAALDRGRAKDKENTPKDDVDREPKEAVRDWDRAEDTLLKLFNEKMRINPDLPSGSEKVNSHTDGADDHFSGANAPRDGADSGGVDRMASNW